MKCGVEEPYKQIICSQQKYKVMDAHYLFSSAVEFGLKSCLNIYCSYCNDVLVCFLLSGKSFFNKEFSIVRVVTLLAIKSTVRVKKLLYDMKMDIKVIKNKCDLKTSIRIYIYIYT